MDEPLNLGLAESDNLTGPYKRLVTEPLVIPNEFPGDAANRWMRALVLLSW